jgi:hypothetical protein
MLNAAQEACSPLTIEQPEQSGRIFKLSLEIELQLVGEIRGCGRAHHENRRINTQIANLEKG